MGRPLRHTTPARLAAAVCALLALTVLIGGAVLWPGDEHEVTSPSNPGAVVHAEVLEVSAGGCEAWAGPGCRLITMRLRSGPAEGRRSYLTLPGARSAPAMAPGDGIRVARNVASGLDAGPVEELPIGDPSAQPFSFVDFDRTSPLLLLALAFCGLVVLLGRWHGVRALLGLAISLWIVVGFVVPALLDGGPPLAVALVGALAVMLVTIVISHGLGITSLAAVLGTATALLLTAGLGLLTLRLTHISGFSSEEATLFLSGQERAISLQGLVLAGLVIGALGVLDDVTVAQASTVLALRRANAALPARRLFGEALAVGRDHLGATVNTLVLAYAGAALPVLLIFNTQATPFGEAVNREPVAEQIVAMLVGSIGLMAAVPLTSLIAAQLAVRLPADRLPAESHARHGH